MANIRLTSASIAGRILPVLLCATLGCGGSTATKEIEIPPAQGKLKTLVRGYTTATRKLKHPPTNAGELKPFLKDFGDPAELLKSPTDGTDLVIGWGTDIAKQTPEGKMPIWAYEKNAHGEKRWIIMGRYPFELTEEQIRDSAFAPGLKKPSLK